ncbi:MAG TPA: M14 family zinc carboxypeptidase [Cytophagales bacterium]|nr:M14 family zinc carboxypeptidase [Cytophagales bacterium]
MIDKLLASYNLFNEEKITHRRFKHKDIVDLLEKFKWNPDFVIEEVGKSIEGRPIFLVKIGHGKVKVLLWSQMHGNEPTATMALMDIFNFFNISDEFDDFRKTILKELSLYFIPMLNPDGAEVFTRRNALNIDINRDALLLECPESKILKNVRDKILPDFGFNLHDMDTRYAVGNTGKPATISFLAPPYDEKKTINQVREKAMKVIVSLNKLLENYIPGQIGKWDDEFEPRAFGDNIQKWGTSTILVESQGSHNDPEKQFVRKLNFILLLKAFDVIADQSFLKEDINHYNKIPFNSRTFFNLVIRNAKLHLNNKVFKIDIGINRYEIEEESGFSFESVIEEIGDMSIFYGYEELDAKGMEVTPGKVYPQSLKEHELNSSKINDLLNDGYTTVIVKDYVKNKSQSSFPINIITEEIQKPAIIGIDSKADLILKEGEIVKYAVVNGFLHCLNQNL